MNISMWTRYSQLGASSRLRFFQFIPLLKKYGIEAECFPFFDDEYLQNLYSGKRRPLLKTAGYYHRRLKQMRHSPPGTPALIEYELLPYLPFLTEKGFLSKHPYILNFDDAVDLKYTRIPVLKNKFRHLISEAAGIITANDMLFEKYRQWNNNIIKLPTIPPEIIAPGKNKPEKLTVVWTGTPVTYQFLYEKRNALQLAAKQVPFDLLIIGGDPAHPIPEVSCSYIPWNEKNEADALARAHAGIMTLPDTPFARGKSAYKLLCYLRAGIPGIASPVGENTKVICHNENGFLAADDRQWCEAFLQLADPLIREKISSCAENSGKTYGLPENTEKLAFFLNSLLNPAATMQN